MTMEECLEKLYSYAVETKVYPSVEYIRNYLQYLFKGLELQGTRMIDIGGGDGLFSFYAACRGAGEVMCLEPEAAGSTRGVNTRFKQLQTRLEKDSVSLIPETLDKFDDRGRLFDIIFSHHSINHLDEESCKKLLEDENARDKYRQILAGIAAIARPGATIIVSDCSRYNFFNIIGMKNPWVPQIEWENHQSPRIWVKLLREAGFTNPRIRWDPLLYTRTPLSPVLSYFLMSHFCITMTKK
jgi:SAM-dependent methyltransferase